MTLHQTLYVYLKANEGWQASAVLERMVWKDNKGKIAKAVTLVGDYASWRTARIICHSRAAPSQSGTKA